MSAGLQPTKADVDANAGGIAKDLQTTVDRVVSFKYWLDAQLDADLTTLGYSSTDITNLRSAYSDLAQLATIYQGAATLSPVKDFRTFAKRIWGLGHLS